MHAQTPVHVIKRVIWVFPIPYDRQNQIIDDWSLKISFSTGHCGRGWTEAAIGGVLWEKVSPSQVSSCEFWEISRNNFSYRTRLVADSALKRTFKTFCKILLFFRSSHRSCSMKKAFLKNSTIFTQKHSCWGFFLIQLQANTGFFLWILRNFQEHFFHRVTHRSQGDCFLFFQNKILDWVWTLMSEFF